MMTGPEAAWRSLRDTLDRLAEGGHAVDLWLRDDDAVAPTPALERLLTLAGGHDIPLALAVIPALTGEPLARLLAASAGVSVAVHGFAHINHAPAAEKKQELGRHRPAASVLAELRQGLATLERLHGRRALPMLVPPWNRIDKGLLGALPEIGFRLLSTFGPPKPAPIAVLNSTVDLIDWKGTRSCRAPAALIAEIAAQAAARQALPVGLLSHHLIHDEAAWDFLETLFAETANHPGCRWQTVSALARPPGGVAPF